MPYLILAGAVLAALVWLGQSPDKRRDWRVASAVAAMAASLGAVVAGVRGAWLISILLLVVAGWLSTAARKRRPLPDAGVHSGMSAAEARAVLGVGAGATAEEIQAAYLRLMKSVHPDRGGTTGLATQLNAARERLLKG